MYIDVFCFSHRWFLLDRCKHAAETVYIWPGTAESLKRDGPFASFATSQTHPACVERNRPGTRYGFLKVTPPTAVILRSLVPKEWNSQHEAKASGAKRELRLPTTYVAWDSFLNPLIQKLILLAGRPHSPLILPTSFK